MRRIEWLALALGTVLGAAGVAYGVAKAAARPPPVVTLPDAELAAKIEGLWVFQRIEACEKQCEFGLSFEVEATKTSFRCTCTRPENVGVHRLAKPFTPKAKIASAE